MKFIKKLSPTLTEILIALASYVLLFAMLAATIAPERYDIRIGEVATTTITATKDVEDTLTTSRRRETAARNVQPSYVSDAQVQPNVMLNLQDRFTQLLQYRAHTPADPSTQAKPEELRLRLQGVLPEKANDDAVTALVKIDEETLSRLYERTFALVRETLSAKVAQGQENEATAKIGRDLNGDGFDGGAVQLALSLVQDTLRPNMLLDEETTNQNREKAMEEVEPVIYKKGQNIIMAGEPVLANQFQMLDELGLLKDHKVDVTLYISLGTLLAFLFLIVVFVMRVFLTPKKRDTRAVALLCVIVVMTVALCMIVRLVDSHLMPVTLGTMLTTLLLNPGLAITINVVLSIITGLFNSMDNGGVLSATMCSTMLVFLISGSICVPMITKRPQRSMIMLSGLVTAIINMLSTMAVGMMDSASQQSIMRWVLWAGGSGLSSAVFCIGLQPALEWLFNLVTPSKLMELSNPNQPLLRRLLLEAPGTYHHSILVANLTEAAANAVGADGLLARVGSYYHDIGKLKRPLYFKENQLSDNPHDRTDPRVSSAILTAHPRDGVEMAQKMRLPEAICQIILQHHGDTPVLYFYDKAMKQGGDVDLSNFRYDCPRPTSKEAAIVMLADTVEAAARTIPDPSPEKVAALIQRLVRSKMEDGQLDECPLTLSDLATICDTFATVLNGVYHERVEYPNVVLPERKTPVEAVEETADNKVAQPEEALNLPEETEPDEATMPESSVDETPVNQPVQQAQEIRDDQQSESSAEQTHGD